MWYTRIEPWWTGNGVICMNIRVPGWRIGNTRSRSRMTGSEVVGLMGGCSSSKMFFCRRKTVWLGCDESSWWWNENSEKMWGKMAAYMLLIYGSSVQATVLPKSLRKLPVPREGWVIVRSRESVETGDNGGWCV